eukprot:g1209.t1
MPGRREQDKKIDHLFETVKTELNAARASWNSDKSEESLRTLGCKALSTHVQIQFLCCLLPITNTTHTSGSAPHPVQLQAEIDTQKVLISISEKMDVLMEAKGVDDSMGQACRGRAATTRLEQKYGITDGNTASQPAQPPRGEPAREQNYQYGTCPPVRLSERVFTPKFPGDTSTHIATAGASSEEKEKPRGTKSIFRDPWGVLGDRLGPIEAAHQNAREQLAEAVGKANHKEIEDFACLVLNQQLDEMMFHDCMEVRGEATREHEAALPRGFKADTNRILKKGKPATKTTAALKKEKSTTSAKATPKAVVTEEVRDRWTDYDDDQQEDDYPSYPCRYEMSARAT